MADDYIDYWEVGEYAEHFLARTEALEGASPLVDVARLRAMVAQAAGGVAAELERAGMQRSVARAGGGEVGEKAQAARREVERFWSYLGSLDEGVAVDAAAFFPGRRLGRLAALKPADVKSKVDEVLRGFAADANQGLPEAGRWRTRIAAAGRALGEALAGTGEARGAAGRATAELKAAREGFLAVYGGVAKPLVRGLLASLGRRGEYEGYFKDLLVGEE